MYISIEGGLHVYFSTFLQPCPENTRHAHSFLFKDCAASTDHERLAV